jgi:hypothetical protein
MKAEFFVVAVIVAAFLTGCGQRDQAGHGPSTSSAIPSTSVPLSATTTTTTLPPSSVRPVPGEPATPVLGDGRYAAYLTAIDTRACRVTFDVIQYLTGQDAADAFHRDHPEITEGPPNGFYIVNQNPRLRTLPVRKGAPVQVIWLHANPGSDTITFDQLPGYVAKDPVKDKYVWYDPFWLTVRAGRVDAIAEQFIP